MEASACGRIIVVHSYNFSARLLKDNREIVIMLLLLQISSISDLSVFSPHLSHKNTETERRT